MSSASIQIYGASATIEAFSHIDGELARELKSTFRDEAKVVLQHAKQYARALGGSGDYANSMAMRTIKRGARISSSDPGAGTIEFANQGAFARKGPHMGKPVGVPQGDAPRALVRAAIEDELTVVDHIDTEIAAIIDRYLHG
jgi:hypothetical protein